MIRTFLHLGFNQDESGSRVFDGAYPHIGGGKIALNVRFAMPGHAWGEQIDHLYPAYDFPFTYAHQHDPLTGREQGLLDRCTTTRHLPTNLPCRDRAGDVGGAAIAWTDRPTRPHRSGRPAECANLHHGEHGARASASVPLAATGRAALVLPTTTQPEPAALDPARLASRFHRNGCAMAFHRRIRRCRASRTDHWCRPTLCAFRQFPRTTMAGWNAPPRAVPRSPTCCMCWISGRNTTPATAAALSVSSPPRIGSAAYGVLVPQVDADGNDIGGIRSVFLQVPVGTYTGWNPFSPISSAAASAILEEASSPLRRPAPNARRSR